MDPTGSAVGLDDVRRWGQQLDDVARRIGARFSRSETRSRVRAYLTGLLGPVRRKNAWQLAERIGDADPYGVQYLMGRADWDPDLVRDDLRAYVVEALGDPEAVLVLDETGFLKKGDKSAGTARQYTGTAGRIENAQVGVFLAYASTQGTALIDRALYLPKEWTDDPKRCTAAGIPEDTAFATKIQLAKAMLGRAFQAGVPIGWVTGDEVYGAWELRRWLEEQGRRYVLAVRANQYVWAGPRQATVAALAKELPKRAWHKITIAPGSKGPRRYAWAWLVINSDLGPTWRRWLLVRRSLDDREELAYYVAADPARTTLNRLAKVAGARWAIEGAFESAKQEVGLADYEVRSWAGWHRHVTLSMLALAVLAAVRVLAGGRRKKVGRARVDRGERAGGPAAGSWLALGSSARGGGGPQVVGVATSPSGVGEALPLQNERRRSRLVTTVVLGSGGVSTVRFLSRKPKAIQSSGPEGGPPRRRAWRASGPSGDRGRRRAGRTTGTARVAGEKMSSGASSARGVRQCGNRHRSARAGARPLDAYRAIRKRATMSYSVPASAVIDYPAEAMASFPIYAFEWIDDLHFIQPPNRSLTDP